MDMTGTVLASELAIQMLIPSNATPVEPKPKRAQGVRPFLVRQAWCTAPWRPLFREKVWQDSVHFTHSTLRIWPLVAFSC